MSVKKPMPLISDTKHDRCPVCGEISYSHTGVHPQCAMRQADAKRLQKLKRDEHVPSQPKPADGIKPWQKKCPRCRAIQHVRKKVCDCGHNLAAPARPPTREIGP